MASDPKLNTELAQQLRGALTADRDELFGIMQNPSQEVLKTALRNKTLGEEHLRVLLKRRDLTEALLRSIYHLPLVESSKTLKVSLAQNPGTPGPILQSLLPHLHLFQLLDLCLLGGSTPDMRVAAERVIIQRIPTTPLGNKITLARRATSTIAEALLNEGDSKTLRPCLANPRLKEVSLLQFLNGPSANADSISMIARHPKWKTRPNLRMAILKNPKTPPVWFTLFLPSLSTSTINNLLASRRLASGQKKLVQNELLKRAG